MIMKIFRFPKLEGSTYALLVISLVIDGLVTSALGTIFSRPDGTTHLLLPHLALIAIPYNLLVFPLLLHHNTQVSNSAIALIVLRALLLVLYNGMLAFLSVSFFLGGTSIFYRYLWLRFGILVVQQITSVITVAFITKKDESKLNIRHLIFAVAIQITLWLFASFLPPPTPIN